MRGKWHYVAAALFFVALIYDFFLWGGLARMPTLSRVMTDATSRELAWGGIYLPVGARMVDLTGLKCPLPAMKTKKALATLAVGDQLDVRCTDPMSVIDIPHLVQQTGNALVETVQTEAGYQFLIRKESI